MNLCHFSSLSRNPAGTSNATLSWEGDATLAVLTSVFATLLSSPLMLQLLELGWVGPWLHLKQGRSVSPEVTFPVSCTSDCASFPQDNVT